MTDSSDPYHARREHNRQQQRAADIFVALVRAATNDQLANLSKTLNQPGFECAWKLAEVQEEMARRAERER